jgi:hypothetical protein
VVPQIEEGLVSPSRRQKQLCLGKTKAEAHRRYREWLIEHAGTLPRADQKKFTIAEVGQEFLDHSAA